MAVMRQWAPLTVQDYGEAEVKAVVEAMLGEMLVLVDAASGYDHWPCAASSGWVVTDGSLNTDLYGQSCLRSQKCVRPCPNSDALLGTCVGYSYPVRSSIRALSARAVGKKVSSWTILQYYPLSLCFNLMQSHNSITVYSYSVAQKLFSLELLSVIADYYTSFVSPVALLYIMYSSTEKTFLLHYLELFCY
jgi:hypothetical protein